MHLTIKEQDKIKKQILDFTIRGVEHFLSENPDLAFYAFAYDCNAEYAEVSLCFNTEAEFQKTLKQYQTSKYSAEYKSGQDVKELKYNTGDWEYQCFDTLYVFTEDELNKIFSEQPEDNYKSWSLFVRELLVLFTESIIEFTKTETYAKIPKTKDFLVFCINHDEDFEDAIKRLKEYKEEHLSPNK